MPWWPTAFSPWSPMLTRCLRKRCFAPTSDSRLLKRAPNDWKTDTVQAWFSSCACLSQGRQPDSVAAVRLLLRPASADTPWTRAETSDGPKKSRRSAPLPRGPTVRCPNDTARDRSIWVDSAARAKSRPKRRSLRHQALRSPKKGTQIAPNQTGELWKMNWPPMEIRKYRSRIVRKGSSTILRMTKPASPGKRKTVPVHGDLKKAQFFTEYPSLPTALTDVVRIG